MTAPAPAGLAHAGPSSPPPVRVPLPREGEVSPHGAAADGAAAHDLRLAWAAVLLLSVSSAVLGLALVLASWPLLVTGLALGTTGATLGRRGHLLESPAGEDAPRDLWPLGPRAARPNRVDCGHGRDRHSPFKAMIFLKSRPLFCVITPITPIPTTVSAPCADSPCRAPA